MVLMLISFFIVFILLVGMIVELNTLED